MPLSTQLRDCVQHKLKQIKRGRRGALLPNFRVGNTDSLQVVEGSMLDWMANTIIAVVSYVPAQLVPKDSPYFALIRRMFAFLFIHLIICTVALQPLRSMWRHMRSGGSTDDSTGPLARQHVS